METEKNEESLVRSSFSSFAEFKPEHVVLVGSGANTLGWEPILRAVEQHKESHGDSGVLGGVDSMSDLSLTLATCAYSYRSIRDHLLLQFVNGTLNVCILKKYVPHLEWFYEFRKKIGDNYHNNSGGPTCSFLRLLNSVDLDKTAFVTTNWDLLLWKDERIRNMVQLHGRADYPDSLIFPSELSADENLISALNLLIKQKIIYSSQVTSSSAFEKFAEVFCRNTLAHQLKKAHEVAIHWTSCAKKITCIGIAFNTYDAELNAVLSQDRKLELVEVWDVNKSKIQRIKQIFNVDPNYVPQKYIGWILYCVKKNS